MKKEKEISMMKRSFTKFITLLSVFIIVLAMVPQLTLGAVTTYNPKEDYEDLGIRFWEDEKPDIGFYIDAAAKYTLETVPEARFYNEWDVMNLLRGMYTGADYMNKIPKNYFKNYITHVEEYVKEKEGFMDRNRLTEWSRPTLPLTALGYDVTNVAGYDFIKAHAVSPEGSRAIQYSNGQIIYTQGINAAIWALIAINAGNYELLEDGGDPTVNTEGKMLDFIIENEITQEDGTVGGWALWGNVPDTDIGGMALQGLAPYYVDRERYEKTDATVPYDEFVKAVERGVAVLADIQLENGGYSAMGFPGATANSQSIVQVLVALTALGIDPLAEEIELSNIGKKINFFTDGGDVDGFETDNMIDALLAFWDHESGSSPEVGGFKNVLSYGVNDMATYQSLYGLIAYDRFLKGEKPLYDMTDMVNGEYKDMSSKSLKMTIEYGENRKDETYAPYELVTIPEGEDLDGKEFIHWNSKADGSGTSYESGEKLSMPDQDITLYGIYDEIEYTISLNANGGEIDSTIPSVYTVDSDTIYLPTAEEISREGFEFAGWYDNEHFNGKAVTSIERGSTGDKTFYAKWNAKSQVDQILVDEVVQLISELPTEVTLEAKNAIEIARLAHDRLPGSLQSLVSNIDKLEYAEKSLESLLEENSKAEVSEVEKLIEELPSPEELIIKTNEKTTNLASASTQFEDHIEQLDKTRNAYYRLSVAQQELIRDELKTKLSSLEEKLFDYLEFDENESKKNILEKRIAGILDKGDLEDTDTIEFINKELESLPEDLQRDVEGLTVLNEEIEKLNRAAEEVEQVEQLIKDLPELSDITLENDAQKEAALTAYENLNDKQKYQVSNYRDLLLVQEKIEQLIAEADRDQKAAEEVKELIDSLPNKDKVTLDDQKSVEEARTAYDKLTEKQKEMVSNIDKLEALEKKLEVLRDEEENSSTDDEEKPNEEGEGSQDDESTDDETLTEVEHPSEDEKTPNDDDVTITDDELNEEDQTLEEKQENQEEGSTLPSTATNLFNVIAIGLSLMLAGLGLYIINRKMA